MSRIQVGLAPMDIYDLLSADSSIHASGIDGYYLQLCAKQTVYAFENGIT